MGFIWSCMIQFTHLKESPGQILTGTARLQKGPELLIKNLAATANVDYVMLGTWNDLGEGIS